MSTNVIDTTKYDEFFADYNKFATKKLLYKKKGLLTKND